MRSTKQELRQQLKADRLAMPRSDVATKSREVSRKLISKLDWANIKNLHIYCTVPEWNEIQAEPIVEYAHKSWPKIRIAQAPTAWNQPLPTRQFDLIIVPCLGFDRDLNRLGLGAGFYDRFLVTQPKALKIGLCFASGLVEAGLPNESHDIRLDAIVTEDNIYKTVVV